MLYLDKILAQLAYPLGASLVLGVLGLLLLAIRRRCLAAGALTVAFLWLAGWSLPVTSEALRSPLEARFSNVPVTELPEAEAVVVLGGVMSPPPPGWPYPDLGSAADRVWHTARIFHAGKAPLVIVSGGNLPWVDMGPTEAEAIRGFLQDLSVPQDAIVLEGRSRNTRENAVFTAELLKAQRIGRVLLVTSALHMPRALAVFQKAGVDAIPVATDFEVYPRPRHFLDWVPNVGALAGSTAALKEYLGLFVYRWRGWV